MYTPQHTPTYRAWRSEDNLRALAPSSQRVGFGDVTEIVRPGRKCSYLLGGLPSPSFGFKYPERSLLSLKATQHLSTAPGWCCEVAWSRGGLLDVHSSSLGPREEQKVPRADIHPMPGTHLVTDNSPAKDVSSLSQRRKPGWFVVHRVCQPVIRTLD